MHFVTGTLCSYYTHNLCVCVSGSALMCVVKLEGIPQLCKTDEIGEICVSSIATGTSYYGLTGMSKNTFEVFFFFKSFSDSFSRSLLKCVLVCESRF